MALTCSFGVATGEGDIDVRQLMRNADAALYRAKANGRNRVEVYDPLTARVAA